MGIQIFRKGLGPGQTGSEIRKSSAALPNELLPPLDRKNRLRGGLHRLGARSVVGRVLHLQKGIGKRRLMQKLPQLQRRHLQALERLQHGLRQYLFLRLFQTLLENHSTVSFPQKSLFISLAQFLSKGKKNHYGGHIERVKNAADGRPLSRTAV
ncbi:hypothetical protein SDC9_198657 [bioreactor metagenome]|uniref:Uncharacterized protein n=1 Tax=bioreactor metagenome TaxID=1076179 RepID=A0A645IJ48_9ZZZZ